MKLYTRNISRGYAGFVDFGLCSGTFGSVQSNTRFVPLAKIKEMGHDKATKPESHESVTKRIRSELEAMKRAGQIPPTQKEQRELRRKEREAEAARAKLTQEDILAKCGKDGHCKVTINDIKNAFPKMVSQIGGNDYRTQIDNKQFLAFLVSNGLMFSLPDFQFTKRT